MISTYQAFSIVPFFWLQTHSVSEGGSESIIRKKNETSAVGSFGRDNHYRQDYDEEDVVNQEDEKQAGRSCPTPQYSQILHFMHDKCMLKITLFQYAPVNMEVLHPVVLPWLSAGQSCHPEGPCTPLLP
jgi:hypothetical protein